MTKPGTGGAPDAGVLTRSHKTATDVGATLREMWATRPARRSDDRKIAGVSAALARRYAIDPTLVRIAFVVAAFYGVGILAYVVGWLVLPRADRPADRDSTARPVIAAVLLTLMAFGPVAGGRPGGLVGILVMTALLYALHRSRASLGHRDDPDAPAGPSDGPEPTDAVADASLSTSSAPAQPPAWDPLGAAPFAWDLPEPSTPPAPRPPRSVLVPVTLGLALLAGAVVLALGLLGVAPLGATPVVGAALGVVGVGLVVGAFRHRGRGLILAAVPLALVLVAASTGGPRGGPAWREGSFGPWADRDGRPATTLGVDDAAWAPTTPVMVSPIYETGLGDAQLDLRALPSGAPVVTTVRSFAGKVTVLVGPTADVTADCQSASGDRVDCLGHGAGRVVDLGTDGPGGPLIDLHAASATDKVEVHRG